MSRDIVLAIGSSHGSYSAFVNEAALGLEPNALAKVYGSDLAEPHQLGKNVAEDVLVSRFISRIVPPDAWKRAAPCEAYVLHSKTPRRQACMDVWLLLDFKALPE